MRSVTQRPPAPQICQPGPEIPEPLCSRLGAEQIISLRQWAKLSERRKRSLFGITERHRRLLDELARGAP